MTPERLEHIRLAYDDQPGVDELLDEVDRLQQIEQAARDIERFLPPADAHNIPSNNLRVALGLLEATK